MSESSAHEFHEAVLEYVREREDSGKTFVKAKQVARELDATGQRAGRHLDMLEQEGHLERWNPGADVPIWQIDTEGRR